MITGNASPEDKLKMLIDLGYDGVEPRAQLGQRQTGRSEAVAGSSGESWTSQSTELSIPATRTSPERLIRQSISEPQSVLHVVRYDRRIGYMQNYKETQDIIRNAVEPRGKERDSHFDRKRLGVIPDRTTGNGSLRRRNQQSIREGVL